MIRAQVQEHGYDATNESEDLQWLRSALATHKKDCADVDRRLAELLDPSLLPAAAPVAATPISGINRAVNAQT